MSTLWTPEPEFRKEELFASIRAQGLHINDSLLQEFQEYGWMLPPRRRSRGRGRGIQSVWTRHQRDLLQSLCHARERKGVHSVAQLCNLPVWVWLYWGDGYGVTLEQVKRVMHTWATRQGDLSYAASRQAARNVVQEVGNQPAGRKRQAIKEITDWLYKGRFTGQNLSDSLHHVFTEHKKANGPQDIPLTPKGAGELLHLRREAATWLAQEQNLPDAHWQWARFFHVHGLSEYLQEQPGYASETAGSPAAHLFSPETIESLFTSTCVDLAMVLYIGLLYPDPPTLPEQLRLAYWQRSVKNATLSARQVVSPLVLPNGSHPMYLELLETVTVWLPGESREEKERCVPGKRRSRKVARPPHRKKRAG